MVPLCVLKQITISGPGSHFEAPSTATLAFCTHVWHKSMLSHELYAWKWCQNVRCVKHDSSEGGRTAYATLVAKLKEGNCLGDVGIDGQIWGC
jgi:hypothetical protein